MKVYAARLAKAQVSEFAEEASGGLAPIQATQTPKRELQRFTNALTSTVMAYPVSAHSLKVIDILYTTSPQGYALPLSRFRRSVDGR